MLVNQNCTARACALDIVAAALGAGEPWVQSLCCDGDARARGLFALAIVRVSVKLEMNDADVVADGLCYEGLRKRGLWRASA